MKKKVALIGLIAIFLIGSLSWGGETINGAGASFATPVYQIWAIKYDKATGDKVNYQSIGSGGGIRQIIERTVDFGASDAPIPPAQLRKSNLIQFPTMIGGVVLAMNIDGLGDDQLKLDSEAVCKMYLGDITFWDDTKIAGLNPSIRLPHAAIVIVHRADASGSTAIFTNYLAGTCADFKAKVGEGTSVKWPVGIGSKGNEGVTHFIMRSTNSIGYVQFVYAKQNKLKCAQLKNRAGNFVAPGPDTFEAVARNGNFSAKNDFYAWLNNGQGEKTWPITGATFILLAKDRKDSSMKALKFFDYAFRTGEVNIRELAYVPLPESMKAEIRAYWKLNGLY